MGSRMQGRKGPGKDVGSRQERAVNPVRDGVPASGRIQHSLGHDAQLRRSSWLVPRAVNAHLAVAQEANFRPTST